jgi:hypothetical protein
MELLADRSDLKQVAIALESRKIVSICRELDAKGKAMDASVL